MDQLSRVKDLPVPEFGSLQAWEARARAVGHVANGDSSIGDSKISQGLGYGGTPMPYSGDTKVTFSWFEFEQYIFPLHWVILWRSWFLTF